jgi:hypothetical protein
MDKNYNKTTLEERMQVFDLHLQGIKKKDIKQRMNIKTDAINKIIKEYNSIEFDVDVVETPSSISLNYHIVLTPSELLIEATEGDYDGEHKVLFTSIDAEEVAKEYDRITLQIIETKQLP